MSEKMFTARAGECEDPDGAVWIIEALTNVDPFRHPPLPEEWGFSDTEQGAALWAKRLNRAFELGKKSAKDGGFGN